MDGTVKNWEGGQYIKLTADIVSAYVFNNSVPASELPDILRSVHVAINGLAIGRLNTLLRDETEKTTPAQIKKSITPDGLISFEDGKLYKILRRHLTIRGLSPETYRAKYGLPADYPMTAASYSAARSALAKELGLGQPRNRTLTGVASEPARDDVLTAATAPEKRRVGRPRKTAVT